MSLTYHMFSRLVACLWHMLLVTWPEYSTVYSAVAQNGLLGYVQWAHPCNCLCIALLLLGEIMMSGIIFGTFAYRKGTLSFD